MPTPGRVAVAADDRSRPLELISTLCETLEAEGVRYCHWKSNEALALSATGENDLDLLIHRSDAQRFEAILRRLGFRDARLASWKELPGVFHSYSLDAPSGKLVHIHGHYQLVIGDDMTKNYRLPIEEPYLASAVRGSLFRTPAPEFELGVFLLRMVVKHCTWDAILTLQGSLSASERRELAQLLGETDPSDVWTAMARQLPFLSRGLWERCLRAVRPGASTWFRIRTAARLQRELVVCARRRRAADTYLRMWRRVRILFRRKIFRRGPYPKRLAAKGTLIAIVGGDGAGKTTAVADLSAWLAKEFPTLTVHMGKPRRSSLSLVLKGSSSWKRYWPGILGLAAALARPRSRAVTDRTHRHGGISESDLTMSLASPNGGSVGPRTVARLAWVTLTARDRYLTYRSARRSTSNGMIVVCDRYPLPQIKSMDGAVVAPVIDPSRRGRLEGRLADLERRYYARIAYPDILIVLRVEPDLAVQRKQGVEREWLVRPRSEEVWGMDWGGTPAIVVDSGRPRDEVLSEIRSIVWSGL